MARRPAIRGLMSCKLARQDDGRCGYICLDYSSAVSLRKEERLNPGLRDGRQTARMLKTLNQEFGNSPPPPARPVEIPLVAVASVALADLPGRSRGHPAEAVFFSIGTTAPSSFSRRCSPEHVVLRFQRAPARRASPLRMACDIG